MLRALALIFLVGFEAASFAALPPLKVTTCNAALASRALGGNFSRQSLRFVRSLLVKSQKDLANVDGENIANQFFSGPASALRTDQVVNAVQRLNFIEQNFVKETPELSSGNAFEIRGDQIPDALAKWDAAIAKAGSSPLAFPTAYDWNHKALRTFLINAAKTPDQILVDSFGFVSESSAVWSGAGLPVVNRREHFYVDHVVYYDDYAKEVVWLVYFRGFLTPPKIQPPATDQTEAAEFYIPEGAVPLTVPIHDRRRP